MNPATAYVGNYTFTLDDLSSSAKKRYLMAVQSGKPVLDEELSEIGYRNLDILRRYLERNVGDAVVDGNRTAVLEVDPIPGRTWRVEESTVTNVNNFVVKGGTSDKPAVLIVKGYPLLLFSDIQYNQQNNTGSLEDDDFTNTTIPALTPPGVGTRTDSVYVDFYLAEVSSEVGSEYQDVSLKDPSLNLQTANRFRVVQDILVAAGTTTIPADGLDANNIYHRYYKLAEITRSAGINTIVAANITDKRTYVNSLESLSNGTGELNVFNAFVQNDLTVLGTVTIINQTETNQEQLVITTNDAGVDALVINKSNTGEALVVNKQDAGYAIEVNDTGSTDAIIINKTGGGYAINIQTGSMLLDNDTDLFYSPSIEGVNSLKTHIENQLELHEPTGFPNRTDTTFTFVNGTRTFTLSPTGSEFSFYVNNTKFTKNAPENVVIPDVEGIHFIYYNNSGILVTNQTPWNLTNTAPVAYVHWDATNNVAIVLAEERHGTVMDGQTHTYLHRTIGTRYVGGLGLSGNTAGSGNVNSDAQVSISDGTVFDEDITITIFDGAGTAFFEQELSPIAYIPIFYRLGAAGDWRKTVADPYPVYNNVGSGRLGWNENAASWQVTEANNSDYVPMFIFATNDVNDPIIAILGQSHHSTFLDAQNNSSYQTLSFGAMPFQEMKILYRLIFQTSNGYSNAVKARLVDIQDLRSISNIPSSNYVATDHGALSGLADQDHPATAIFTNFTNFNGGLTATDTSVQIALDTLDDIWVRLSPSSPNTDDLYRMGDVIIGTNTAAANEKLRVADTFGNKHIVRIQALGTPLAQGNYGGQLFLTADVRDVKLASVVETNIGTESWATYPRVGLQIDTVSPGGIINALRITHDGRFGFGTQVVTAGYRAEVSGALYVTGAERIDGALTQNGVATFNNTVNLSTQTADRVALIDNSKNLVSTTVTLAELQVLDDFVENVQDIVGGMVTGNTENGIVVTYDDPTGKLNFDVNDPVLTIAGGASGSATMTNLGNTTITVVLNTEDVEDIVGGMVTGNTENGITVTYDDANGKLNFDVNDPVLTLSGDVSGSATMTNLGNTTITVDISDEVIQDMVGAMVSGNTESGIAVTYDDTNGKLDFNVSDFTITLTGDVSASGTVTDLGNVSMSVTVADDSHNHSNTTITSLAWGKLTGVPSPTITLTGDVTGSGTMTSLGNVSFATTVSTEVIQDIVGAMVSSNTEGGIAVTYDDPNGKLNFDVDDFTITLAGDLSGSVTITNLASATLTASVGDDSHNHTNTTISSLAWSKLTSVPSPTITLTSDVTGSGTMTSLGSVSITTTVADDSHNHSNSTLSSLAWSKLSSVPSPTITLTGGVTGSGTMTSLGSVSIATSVSTHTHDDRYYTELESDTRFVNASGDSMTGTLFMGTNKIEWNVGSDLGRIFVEEYTAGSSRLVIAAADDGDSDYIAFRNTHYSSGDYDAFEVHRSYNLSNALLIVANGIRVSQSTGAQYVFMLENDDNTGIWYSNDSNYWEWRYDGSTYARIDMGNGNADWYGQHVWYTDSTGGEVAIRLWGNQTYNDHGARLAFGDGDWCYLQEVDDDVLKIRANSGLRIDADSIIVERCSIYGIGANISPSTGTMDTNKLLYVLSSTGSFWLSTTNAVHGQLALVARTSFSADVFVQGSSITPGYIYIYVYNASAVPVARWEAKGRFEIIDTEVF